MRLVYFHHLILPGLTSINMLTKNPLFSGLDNPADISSGKYCNKLCKVFYKVYFFIAKYRKVRKWALARQALN